MTLRNLQATAAVLLMVLSGTVEPGMAQAAQQASPAQMQEQTPQGANSAQQSSSAAGQSNLPPTPEPRMVGPLYLRDTGIDYSNGKSWLPNPLKIYTPTSVPPARLGNTPRLDQLMKDGKIYLSLSDAVLLALENNFDIAIARINLDIADTDLLRAKAGAGLRGVSTGLVTGTLGGVGNAVTGGGGPGGTSSGAGGGGTGANGLVLSTNGGGPAPENLDPFLTANMQYESLDQQQSNLLFSGGKSLLFTNTATYNFGYQQGFVTGTQLNVTFNNQRVTTNNPFTDYSPDITTTFRATATQHLLQGFGLALNQRFIVQAKNDRRITDAAFRQQVLYTVNQVENIYWGLASAYEDEQAKERALAQSTQLTQDNRRQLQIGTLAPLDIVNSDAAVATDQQSLTASKSNLEYQQLLMKQAIARNLEDPTLTNAPIIPTDRIALDKLAEEDESQDQLVQEAYANNPQIEQAALSMKNNEITMKAERNGMLPTVDAFAFYGASQLAGAQSPNALNFSTGQNYPPGQFPSIAYGTAVGHLFDSSAPDKGVGVNITIPLRNRVAQADQARSQMEYRQAQMRLQQLYTQIRIQVVNALYALTNDRAQVSAAQAGRDYAAQSLDAEQKKYKLGASTSANVLQQERNMANSDAALISSKAAYARDRAALLQLLSKTLDRYGINIAEAATGVVSKAPAIPGLTAPTQPEGPKPIVVGPTPQ